MSKTGPAQFVRQVRQELKRITWATKRNTNNCYNYSFFYGNNCSNILNNG